MILTGIVSSYCVTGLYQRHTSRQTLSISSIALLPEPIAKLLVMEFPGLTSDYLMLNTLTFLGEKLIGENGTSPEEWQMIYQALVQITNLDPRATDPYVLAETTLPWEADMVQGANEILEKAAIARPSDSRPYFFLWYNYYYILQDPKKAAHYLEKAAAVPSAPKYYATLAARMRLYSGQIMTGIVFLKEILKETTDPKLRAILERRLETLEKIAYLEEKLQEYKKRYNRQPKILADLIAKGLISEIPSDPYGGVFYINPEGRVFTSSELSFAGAKKNKQQKTSNQ